MSMILLPACGVVVQLNIYMWMVIRLLMNKNIFPEKIAIVHSACRVKKAYLVHDLVNDTFSLIHYDTEIMTIDKDRKITKALKCSNSSTRAIKQVCEYFNIDMPKLEPFYDFRKYEMGA